MIVNSLIKYYPLLLGSWILRSTNDISLSKGLTYIVINNDETLRLKILNQEGFIGTKKSMREIISNISCCGEINYSINLKYSHSNKYLYSFFGIKIPELKSEIKNYIIVNKLNIKLLDKSILVTDFNSPLYYLFDFCVGKIQYSHVDIGLNTFIFIQFIGFFLNLTLANLLHDILSIWW